MIGVVKLQEVDGQFFLTIPRDYVKLKKWKKGQEIAVGFNERHNLELREIP